jgi:hypothetical protein
MLRQFKSDPRNQTFPSVQQFSNSLQPSEFVLGPGYPLPMAVQHVARSRVRSCDSWSDLSGSDHDIHVERLELVTEAVQMMYGQLQTAKARLSTPGKSASHQEIKH